MENKKYPIGGFAPGNYTCRCFQCKNSFMGDKRAVQCEPCAVACTLLETGMERNKETRILLGSQLIAGFMEVDFTIPYMWRPGAFTEFTEEHLAYHKSYDWLLPVMFKFRDLQIDSHIHPNLVQKLFYDLSYENKSVEELFFQVVEAIQWYEENK